jgi:hypothetical protein
MFGLVPQGPAQRIPAQPRPPVAVVPGANRAAGLGMHPGTFGHAAPVGLHPAAVGPMAQGMNQRAEINTQMAKQRALAQALRGGMGNPVPPPMNPQIVRPQGLPMVK